MHRIFKGTAALVAMLFALSGAHFAPAAHAQEGVTGNSYTSPSFGYTIEWTDDWSADPDNTTSDSSGDVLELLSDTAAVWVTSVADTGETPQQFVDRIVKSSNLDATDYDGYDSASSDAALRYLHFTSNGAEIDDWIQGTRSHGALILTEVRTNAGLGPLAAAVANLDITFDGNPILPSFYTSDDSSTGDDTTAKPSPTPKSKGSKDDTDDTSGDTVDAPSGWTIYKAPTYGISLAYDPDLWDEQTNEAAKDNDNDRDTLFLKSSDDDVPANLYFESYDSATRASDCFDTALQETVGDPDDATPLKAKNGDVIEGSSKGVKFGAYSFESNSGTEENVYVECRALPDAGGVLAITLITLPDTYDDAYSALEDILDTVSLTGDTVEGSSKGSDDSTNSKDTDTNSDSKDSDTDSGSKDSDTNSNDSSNSGTRKTPTPAAKSGAGSYVSPTYGFSVQYDKSWKEGDVSSDQGIDQQILTSGDITLIVYGIDAGSNTAKSCVSSFGQGYESAQDVTLSVLTNNGDDLAGTTDLGYYTAYSYPSDQGDRALYVECGLSPDKSYLVLFVAEAPLDETDDIADDVFPIIDTLKF